MRKCTMRGFSLIELLIVIAIMGILVAIAYPAYQDQLIASRRSDGHAALMNLAALMEAYYMENDTYFGANPSVLGITTASQQGYYTVSISSSTSTTFTLSATPVGAQTADTTCGTLTLTNTNEQGPNSETCWH